MKKHIAFLGLSILVFSACQKDPNVAPETQKVPSADPAHNICVISKEVSGKGNFGCNTDDPGSEEHCGGCAVDAIGAKNALVKNLQYGLSGTKYTVLDSGSWSYSGFTCAGGSGIGYLFKATVWAKYDCRGTAVNVKLYGPFPYSILDAKKAEYTRELESQGYKIAYVSYDSISSGTNLYDISFYYYTEDLSNAAQVAAVSALHDAAFINAYTGNANRSLSDTLQIAKKVYPEIAGSLSVKRAEKILSVIQTLR